LTDSTHGYKALRTGHAELALSGNRQQVKRANRREGKTVSATSRYRLCEEEKPLKGRTLNAAAG